MVMDNPTQNTGTFLDLLLSCMQEMPTRGHRNHVVKYPSLAESNIHTIDNQYLSISISISLVILYPITFWATQIR